MHAENNNLMPEGLLPGAMVNQYRIVTCLGSGGMGDVCLAEDTMLNRKVALKFLAGAYLIDENSRARFIREARAAAALSHPYIITIYEVGEYRGRPYIAMELVEGKTLREMIPDGGMEILQAVSIASQICEGLAEAHRKGLIHRDIKPANIMIDTSGRARILDFGLARTESDPKVTQSGTTPGTTAYVSPEQVKGEAATVASDLFSLGVLMYQMLTGKLPFGGEYDASILYAIVNEIPPAPSTLRAEIPPDLDAIVNRLLEKDPHQRFESASEVRDALDGISEPSASRTPVLPKRDWLTKRLWYTVALIIAALGLGIGLPSLLKVSPPASTERKMIAVLPFQNMGPAEDDYFADGMTDAITQHLAKSSGLRVISRTSSMLYKHSDKTPDEIGIELGAGYLLTGSIHWDKSQTPNRVKINTALIRVGERADIWDETYERSLEKLFALQSDVATDVTRALQVTIGRADRASLKAKPTDNLDAYDFYLRGNDYFYRTWEQADILSAVQMYERAVALDSNFAAAWAMLARGDASMYWEYFDRSDQRKSDALHAAQKALAIQPDLADGHLALGYCYYHLNQDYESAMKEFNVALASQPNNADLYNAVAAVQRREGKLQESSQNFLHALELDPRSHQKAFDVALTFGLMRMWALADQSLDRSIELAPDWPLAYIYKAWLAVVRNGNVTRARQVLGQANGKADLTRSKYYWWLLRVVEPDPSKIRSEIALGADTIAYYLELAQLSRLSHDDLQERIYADSALRLAEPRVKERPDDARYHSYLGLAYAGLRKKVEALAEGQKAVQLLPTSQDAFDAPFWVVNLAETMVIFDEKEAAVQQLQMLLSIPGFVSVPYLKLDPLWTPLRDYPGFQKLMQTGA